MRDSIFKINYKIIFVSIILFFLIRFWSPVFIFGTSIAPFYTLISKLITLVGILYYVMIYRKASVPFIIITTYFAIRFFTTIVHCPQNLSRVFMGAYPILAIICIMEIFLEKNQYLFMNGFAFILRCLCVVNAIQSIICPNVFEHDGIYEFIIGGENQIVFAYIVSVIIEVICHNDRKKFLKFYIILLTLSIIKIFSAGNILGWMIFLFLFFYYRKPRKIKAIKIFYVYCIGWGLIVVVRIQNIFSWLIIGILHKNLTLTNRTVIWDNALSSIRLKPILGYGVQETVNLFYTYILRPGKPTVNSWFSAHNQVVQTLYESGILSMIPIIFFAVISLKKLDENKKSRLYSVLVAGIIGILVSMIAEAPGWDSLLVVLALAFNVKKISTNFKLVGDNCVKYNSSSL